MSRDQQQNENQSGTTTTNSSSDSNMQQESDDGDDDGEENEATTSSNNNKEKSVANLTLKQNMAEFFNEKAYGKLIKYQVENQIKILSQLIERHFNEVGSLRTIINTRCPIVRLFHRKAAIYCDLSINNL